MAATPERVPVDRLELLHYRNRRRMAWASFFLLSATGIALLGVGVLRPGGAEIVGAMMPIITALFTAWGTVILAYIASKTVGDWRSLGPD